MADRPNTANERPIQHTEAQESAENLSRHAATLLEKPNDGGAQSTSASKTERPNDFSKISNPDGSINFGDSIYNGIHSSSSEHKSPTDIAPPVESKPAPTPNSPAESSAPRDSKPASPSNQPTDSAAPRDSKPNPPSNPADAPSTSESKNRDSDLPSAALVEACEKRVFSNEDSKYMSDEAASARMEACEQHPKGLPDTPSFQGTDY